MFFDYLPRPSVVLHGEVTPPVQRFWADTAARPACCARQGAAASGADDPVPEDRGILRPLQPFGKSACAAPRLVRQTRGRHTSRRARGGGPGRGRAARRARFGARGADARVPASRERRTPRQPAAAAPISPAPRRLQGGAARSRPSRRPAHALRAGDRAAEPGFVWPETKLAIVTEAELYPGQVRQARSATPARGPAPKAWCATWRR